MTEGVDRDGGGSEKAAGTSIERDDGAVRIPQEAMRNLTQIDPGSDNLSQVVYIFGRGDSSGAAIERGHRTVEISQEPKLQMAEIEVLAVKADDLFRLVYAGWHWEIRARGIERGELAVETPYKGADRHRLLVAIIASDTT